MIRRPWTRPRLWAGLLFAAGLVLLAQGGWIQAKAALAQTLLQRAWSATLADGEVHPPWPWADHWPVARLRVPRHGIDQIVLHGDAGNTLAFAPGHNPKSTLPPTTGTVLISGHRDTHFRFLEALRPGDIVHLETPAVRARYRVTRSRVVDAKQQRITLSSINDALLLVTCYPFDRLAPGGPLRLVVTAAPA